MEDAAVHTALGIAAGRVVVVGKAGCKFCALLRELLDGEVDVAYAYVDVTGAAPELTEGWVRLAGGRRTVPQLFVGTTHVGGYDDARAAADSLRLQQLLSAEGIETRF